MKTIFSCLFSLIAVSVLANSNDDLLFQSIASNDFIEAETALKKGANIDKVGWLDPTNDSDKWLKNVTPLFYAISKDNIEAVEFLLRKGADVNQPTKMYIPFAIQRSISAAPKILELLIRYGADPNFVDRWGYSILQKAMRDNSLKHAKILLDLGADINYKKPSGAHQAGDTTLMQTILAYEVGKELAPIKFLLDYGANPNDRNEESYSYWWDHNTTGAVTWKGYSALTFSVKRGWLEVVELLLDYGADPLLPRTDGKSPIRIAKELEHEEIYELLSRYLSDKSKNN